MTNGGADALVFPTTSTTMEITFKRRLTAVDRCDACQARAKLIVTLASGKELLLCGHHAQQHGKTLKSQGAVLTEPPADDAPEPEEPA